MGHYKTIYIVILAAVYANKITSYIQLDLLIYRWVFMGKGKSSLTLTFYMTVSVITNRNMSKMQLYETSKLKDLY